MAQLSTSIRRLDEVQNVELVSGLRSMAKCGTCLLRAGWTTCGYVEEAALVFFITWQGGRAVPHGLDEMLGM